MIMKRKIIGILFLFLLSGQFAQAILVRFPNLTGVVGDTLTVPLYVDDDLTGSNVISFQFNIAYSSSAIKLLGVNSSGTISSTFNGLSVNDGLNYFKVAGAGTSPLVGKGVLFNVKFVLLASGTYLQFQNTQTDNFFNEGSPAMTFTIGYISIASKPVIYVNPSTAILNVGDTQQFSGSGGTAPYAWTVSDNSIATIDSNGKLTALKNGTVKVTGTDSKGYFGISGIIDCRSFAVNIRDTSFYQNNYIEIPILIQNFDATPVLAGKFSFSFSPNVITFDSLITANSILVGKASVEFSKQSGKAVVSFAGTTGIVNSGTLFKLRFKIADIPSAASYITFDEALLNEVYVPKWRNGYFSIKPLPTIYISPGSAEMFTGDNKQFSVSGGTAPYTWEVENPLLATTTGAGYLNAKSGGITKLLVKDYFGSKTSCTVTIYDTWANVRDSSAVVNQRVISLPIDLGNVPAGKGIISLSGKAYSSFAKIDSMKVENAGTLTSNWQIANKTLKNQSNFAMSGTVPITNGGKIAFIKIYFSPTIQVGDAFYIDCNEFILNEGNPNVKVKSGYLSIKSIISAVDNTEYIPMISIFPVPASDKLNITIPTEFRTSSISVLDLSGKIILSTSIDNFGEQHFVLPIELLRKGFYMLKLQNQHYTKLLKFIKE
jgi:hypothetical protein